MPSIQRLSPEVSSQIAAGEVVERPASMLKELIENSLDAGASRIEVEVAQAGKKSLRVSDDGHGMEPEDCARSLERHATSKISSLADLDRLGTFGFRGEALFAVAAVSRLSLASSQRGAAAGWKVEAAAGRILSSGPAPAAPGTTVEARDLFFNTPARLKFLKSDSYEKGRLISVLEEAALANPEVHFSCKSEGRKALLFAAERSPDPVESRLRRAAAVLGPDLSDGLIPAVAERPGLKLCLFLSPPERPSASRYFQFWLLNRRPIASRLLQQALYRAYEEHRLAGKHPVCVGHLELCPDSFDVNVHPGKREVRFKSDRDIFEVVSGLARSALLKAQRAGALWAGAPAAPALEVREAPPAYRGGPAAALEPFLGLQTVPSQALAAPESAPAWFTPPYRYLGQIEKSYLLFEAAGGLFMLDQHAAAERILFEKLMAEIEEGPARAQNLMLPLCVELPASAVPKVLSKKERLERLGFTVEPFGKTGLRVLAVPALIGKDSELKEVLHRLVDSLGDPVNAAQEARHDALATVACKAAVKAHDPLGPEQALRLLEDLKDCRDGSCCPHGRRAILAMNREELARRFQRPGAPPL
ncbi:MAG: DNA mismatch repair endonuclease MutL [Elusimicrobia bacterium]|nr:DNA mismatch repair endonuclease MutL [Elusimicrobiota bacterium]